MAAYSRSGFPVGMLSVKLNSVPFLSIIPLLFESRQPFSLKIDFDFCGSYSNGTKSGLISFLKIDETGLLAISA